MFHVTGDEDKASARVRDLFQLFQQVGNNSLSLIGNSGYLYIFIDFRHANTEKSRGPGND